MIKDVKLTSLDGPATPEIYQSDSQNGEWMFSLVVRSSLPTRDIEKMVQAEAAAVTKDLPAFNVRTMEQAISTSVAPRRFTMMLISLFAALAVTLTAVGIYGVVSYSVSQQTREIGIRMALGASHRAVLGLMLRQGMGVGFLGIVIGLAGGLAFTRLIAAQLFGVSATDPVTFVIVATLLILVTLLACYLPARRATKVDPMEALRYE
jgi:putative ABC transport system permease protein